MKKVILIGANGQLGHDLVNAFHSASDRFSCTALTHTEIEVTEAAKTREVLTSLQPDIVINTAAYHRVDEMEDNLPKSFEVNTTAVHNLAGICRDLETVLVHFSTDYVFGGDTGRQIPYKETDTPFPINVYGVSKLAGEYAARSTVSKHFVIRVSGLYGPAGSSGKGGNFVELMVRLAKEGKPIKVVDDQCLTPTYTVDLAQKVIELLETDAYGLYHMTSTNECTWYNFAGKIFELIGYTPDFEPTTTAFFGAKATRPAYSVLDNVNLRHIGLTDMRPWEEALHDYLQQKGHLTTQ